MRIPPLEINHYGQSRSPGSPGFRFDTAWQRAGVMQVRPNVTAPKRVCNFPRTGVWPAASPGGEGRISGPGGGLDHRRSRPQRHKLSKLVSLIESGGRRRRWASLAGSTWSAAWCRTCCGWGRPLCNYIINVHLHSLPIVWYLSAAWCRTRCGWARRRS